LKLNHDDIRVADVLRFACAACVQKKSNYKL